MQQRSYIATVRARHSCNAHISNAAMALRHASDISTSAAANAKDDCHGLSMFRALLVVASCCLPDHVLTLDNDGHELALPRTAATTLSGTAAAAK